MRVSIPGTRREFSLTHLNHQGVRALIRAEEMMVTGAAWMPQAQAQHQRWLPPLSLSFPVKEVAQSIPGNPRGVVDQLQIDAYDELPGVGSRGWRRFAELVKSERRAAGDCCKWSPVARLTSGPDASTMRRCLQACLWCCAHQRYEDPDILSLHQFADYDQGSASTTGEKHLIGCQFASALNRHSSIIPSS